MKALPTRRPLRPPGRGNQENGTRSSTGSSSAALLEYLRTASARLPLLTILLAGASWGVFELTRGDHYDFVLRYLLMRQCTGSSLTGELTCSPPFQDLLRGELWRLLTPAFVHGDVFHFWRNTIYLLWFGAVVERVDGRRTLLGLVIGLQLLTALVELSFHLSGHWIVCMGMSGVVYGLAGYILSRRWFDRRFLASTWQVTAVYAGLVLLMEFMATQYPSVRVVHVGGFAIGASWGVVVSFRRREAVA